VAVLVVVIYFSTAPIRVKSLHDNIYNVILAFTFLGFFIIQKAFNKFSTALNLKMNELLSAHENASNRLVDIENKSEAELLELSEYYSKMAASLKLSGTDKGARSIEELMTISKRNPEEDGVEHQVPR
jgi:low affinity Fe/Cu permease